MQFICCEKSFLFYFQKPTITNKKRPYLPEADKSVLLETICS